MSVWADNKRENVIQSEVRNRWGNKQNNIKLVISPVCREIDEASVGYMTCRPLASLIENQIFRVKALVCAVYALCCVFLFVFFKFGYQYSILFSCVFSFVLLHYVLWSAYRTLAYLSDKREQFYFMADERFTKLLIMYTRSLIFMTNNSWDDFYDCDFFVSSIYLCSYFSVFGRALARLYVFLFVFWLLPFLLNYLFVGNIFACLLCYRETSFWCYRLMWRFGYFKKYYPELWRICLSQSVPARIVFLHRGRYMGVHNVLYGIARGTCSDSMALKKLKFLNCLRKIPGDPPSREKACACMEKGYTWRYKFWCDEFKNDRDMQAFVDALIEAKRIYVYQELNEKFYQEGHEIIVYEPKLDFRHYVLRELVVDDLTFRRPKLNKAWNLNDRWSNLVPGWRLYVKRIADEVHDLINWQIQNPITLHTDDVMGNGYKIRRMLLSENWHGQGVLLPWYFLSGLSYFIDVEITRRERETYIRVMRRYYDYVMIDLVMHVHPVDSGVKDYFIDQREDQTGFSLHIGEHEGTAWERDGFYVQSTGTINIIALSERFWRNFTRHFTLYGDEEEFFEGPPVRVRHESLDSLISMPPLTNSPNIFQGDFADINNLGNEGVDDWDDRPAWMHGFGDHMDFTQTISMEEVIDSITDFGDDFKDKVEVLGWLFKPQEHRFSTITFYEHIAKLLYRLCNVDSLASAIAFIHDVGVLFQADFNITSYMVKASCYLTPLIEELTQFVSTASWTDSFKENFIYANFRSFLKLVGVAIIGPIVWAVLGKFFFDPVLIKWYSSEASDVKSYANAVSELITLIANNPYYLVSRDINDIIRFEPPGFNLFKKLVSIEKTIEAFTLKTSVDEILDAVCTLDRLETDIMATVSFAKLPGEVNGANILMDKVTRMRKSLLGRVAEDIHRLEPVGLEIYSPQTKIGKSTMAMRLARDLLSYKGYSMVHNLIHVYEQEKFAESAGTFTKVVIMDDPDVSNTKEGQDSMIAQLMAMIDSTKHYIRKAAVEKKQIDYWDLHAAIVTCNTPTTEIAATLMRSTECIGRRLKYRIIPKLLDGCTEFSKAASKPNDAIWECQLFVWTDDHQNAAGYVDTGKIIRYGDVLSLLISESNMNEAILRDRMSEKPAPVCQACIEDWRGPCTHGSTERVSRDPRFKATIGLADVPYGFKLIFGAILGFCLFPSFMLGFVYSLAFIDWYFNLFWRASGWFARKYFKLRRGVSMTKDEIFDIWKIHKANITGFLLLAAVVYGGQKLYSWWMKEAEAPEFKATMEYSNSEIPTPVKKVEEIPVLYPKSSNGVQDLEKWKRDVLAKNLYCLQVYYGDEIKNNFCNAVSVGGNLLAVPHHVVRGEIIHTIIRGCDRVAPKGVFSHTIEEFHNIKEDVSVFARGGFFLASDLTKFMLEQTPTPGQHFTGGIVYRSSENVLIHKVCSFVYTIDFKPIANVSANGVVGISNYYIADCVCPEGSSGGLAYAVRDGKPFILGSNVATSFKLKQVVIQAWFKNMFTDVDTRMKVNFNVTPPLADEFESFNRVLSKVEVVREPVSDDSLWGINATNVGRASTMSIKQSSTLEDLDASGEFRATMCECLDVEIKKFIIPVDKIDDISAVHKHLSKATCERLVPALVLDKVAEMWFEVNRKRLTRYKDEPYRLPHEAALRGWDADRWNQLPMTSLKLSTSSGLRGGGVKREHVIVTPTPEDPNKFILDEDMKQRYNIINLMGTRHHVVAPVIFSSSLKMNEPRPVGKHCRVFNFMGMAKTVVDREVVFPILSMLVGGFLETGVAIGGVTFNEDCQLMFERLKKARRHFGLDIKGMDMSQGKDIQMVIVLLAKKLFKLNGWPDEDFEVFKTQYLMVIHWCTHYKFDIIYPMSGMPTGFVGTTLQNCLIIQLCMVFCAMQVSQLHQISFAEAWRELVNLIYGDDQTPSFRDLVCEVPITLYAASFNALGFQVTLADKTDIADAKPEALLGELEFLKRKFQEIRYNDKVYVVMSLSFESIYKMLVFREPSSAVTREEWIRIVFDNAQFEMAFHGQETYEKCHDVLVIYKNKNDPSLIIKPWSFWIEKFLSGVAPYQYC